MAESTIIFKAVSSLEKCFYDDDINKFAALESISMLKNEKLSFQLAFRETNENGAKRFVSLVIDGELKDYISVKQTVCVPCAKPVEKLGHNYDDNYLRTEPGLYPDLIDDLHYDGKIVLSIDNLRTFWLDIALPEDVKGGEYPLTFALKKDDEVLTSTSLTVTVIDKQLPEGTIPHTEWFYTDCIADYYDIDVFSDKHWQYIENFIKTAKDNGVNMIMMPVFTPELDTYYGGERTTTQLLGITKSGDEYSFDFTLMDRWVEMCKKLGIMYYEIPHLYTQWGAHAAPKFVATVDGEVKRIFGWETDSLGDEYIKFLDAFLPALVEFLKNRGIADKTFFHISDEPMLRHLEHYGKVAENVKKHLDGFTVIDAVSSIEVFNRGILETPVVEATHIHQFLDAGADKAWVYYACNQTKVYTNRYMAMPSARTRILGIQMYKYNLKGFLHWGYNFYNTQYSYSPINPFLDTCGEYFACSGDAYLVYPGRKGTPLESIRLKQMRDAFQDIRALELLEKHYGREYVINMIDEGLEKPITFEDYPKSADYILNLRAKVNKALAEI